jgi:integrase
MRRRRKTTEDDDRKGQIDERDEREERGMGKRGNGEGSIIRRADGRWQARITLGGGKRISLYARTRQEVAHKLSETLRDRDKGLLAAGEPQTVDQYLASWLETVRPTLRESTWIRYEKFVRVQLRPAVGGVQLNKLSAQQVQALYAALLEQGLSPTTVHHLHTVLHHALKDAQRLGLVVRNVADLVDPPRMAERVMHVYTPEQAQALLAAARGQRLEALVALALTTGMRQGELLALRWGDVDLTSGTLQVRHTRQQTRDGFRQGPPKTRSGRRRILLTPTAIASLRAQHVRQAAERLQVGAAWRDEDLIFTTGVGTALDANNLRKQYVALTQRAGLPRGRFHDLRHTAATLLLLQGVPAKVVSEMLGHASIAITLDLYSHVLPEMQSSAVAAMERLIARG